MTPMCVPNMPIPLENYIIPILGRMEYIMCAILFFLKNLLTELENVPTGKVCPFASYGPTCEVSLLYQIRCTFQDMDLKQEFNQNVTDIRTDKS